MKFTIIVFRDIVFQIRTSRKRSWSIQYKCRGSVSFFQSSGIGDWFYRRARLAKSLSYYIKLSAFQWFVFIFCFFWCFFKKSRVIQPWPEFLRFLDLEQRLLHSQHQDFAPGLLPLLRSARLSLVIYNLVLS